MVLIYIFFFSIWLRSVYVKYGFNISAFLISLYLIGSILCGAIMLFYPDYIKHYDRITFTSVSAHIVILFLMMYPIIRYGNSIKVENIHVGKQSLSIFSWFIAICTISCIIVSCVDIGQILMYGDFAKARNAYMLGELDSEGPVKRWGYIGYFIAMGNLVSFIATFLFFYWKFYLKQNSILTYLLFLGSFTIAIENLTIAGRDGIIRCILFYVANYALFKKYIIFRQHKGILAIFCSIGIIGGIFFSAISNDRFKNSDRGVFFSLIRYGGEQFYLFSYNYQRFFSDGMNSMEVMFPIIYGDQYTAHDLNKLARADFYLNTFSTIAGSFVQRIGVINTLILVFWGFITLSLIFWRKYKFSPNIGLAKIISFLIFYEILMLGYFYYMHYTKMLQVYLIFCVFLAYVISCTQTSRTAHTPKSFMK